MDIAIIPTYNGIVPTADTVDEICGAIEARVRELQNEDITSKEAAYLIDLESEIVAWFYGGTQ